jgi:hypothetical protein
VVFFWKTIHLVGGKMIWKDAVVAALHRYSARHHTKLIVRQSLIDEELDQICKDTDSLGATPAQTMSRVLQELRDEDFLYFTGNGEYLLADVPIDVEYEDLPDDAIDFALNKRKLQLNIVPAGDFQAQARHRKGQNRIRELTLRDYGYQCGFCDVNDSKMLIASHIVRWADDSAARGNLSNVICLCRLHDPLFELGYLSMSDNYQIIRRNVITSQMIQAIMQMTKKFRVPRTNLPSPEFLRQHRIRTGLE